MKLVPFKNKCSFHFSEQKKLKEVPRSLSHFSPIKKESKGSPTAKELSCARRVGTCVLKAKASRSCEVDRIMLCVCFTLSFIKRTKVQIFPSSYLYLAPKFENFHLLKI